MIKGSAQKYETLQDGSVKLSIYYPREFKKQVLDLEGDEVATMSLGEYEALKEGFTGSISTEFADRLIGGLEALLNQLTNEKKVREE